MPNKRDLKLDTYGISKARYRELYYFCLQYRDMVKAKLGCYFLDGRSLDGLRGKGGKTDATAQKAVKAAMLGEKILLIEQTAQEADAELYPWILEAVTTGKSWEEVCPPCGIRQFRQLRRKFYTSLDAKK
ncbi:MAG: hypothetical protein FWE20_11610 [Defluviitaleaceae bacterium]|nr:hypothetical protein [Defluviitaleaceae bacterium]